NFETNAAGGRAMFCKPTFSGTTADQIDSAADTVIENVFPGNHAAGQGLHVNWNWTNASPPAWPRLTTAGGGGNKNPNPVVEFGRPLGFDMYASKDIKVGLGLRETSPSGAIGGDAGGSSAAIEFVGVTGPGTPPAATNIVSAGAWTTVIFDL